MDLWRRRSVERAVSRGAQDPRDLLDVERNGIVTRPGDCLDVRCLSCYPPPRPRKRANA